jgi:hypothetical protein
MSLFRCEIGSCAWNSIEKQAGSLTYKCTDQGEKLLIQFRGEDESPPICGQLGGKKIPVKP